MDVDRTALNLSHMKRGTMFFLCFQEISTSASFLLLAERLSHFPTDEGPHLLFESFMGSLWPGQFMEKFCLLLLC